MNKLTELINTVSVGDVVEQLRLLPENCIDLTVTSPPYNKKRERYGWLVNTNGYSHFDDHMPEEEYQLWQVQVLNELFRVTKPGSSLFYNHKIRWVDGRMIHPYLWLTQSQWILRQEIVWDRGLAANMRGWRFWQVDERIYWLYKPLNRKLVGKELESKHAKMSSIWRLPPANRVDHHPAPFPIELPIRIIYSLTNESNNMVIIDPFCGTGTTLIAARILGHSYIGFDISPTYVEYSQARLERYLDEVPQAEKEMAKHFIEDPFVDRKKRGTVNWPYGPKKNKDLPIITSEDGIDEGEDA